MPDSEVDGQRTIVSAYRMLGHQWGGSSRIEVIQFCDGPYFESLMRFVKANLHRDTFAKPVRSSWFDWFGEDLFRLIPAALALLLIWCAAYALGAFISARFGL